VTIPKCLTLLCLAGISLLSACAGVETGAVSPCHGQFRAEGKYFAAREQSDGSTIVVSTMNAPETTCAD
jgi:hypothetical protein